MHYILIFLFFTVSARILYKHENSASYKKLITIAWLIFALFAGLRYELGVDFFSYKRHLADSPTIFRFFDNLDNYDFEPGYKLCLALIKTVTNEIQIVLLVASLFCTYVLFRVFKEYIQPKYIFISLLTYFFSTYMLLEMQALRQAIAAAFIYLGYSQLIKGRIKKAYLCVIAGTTFHSSALFFLPIFLFIDKKIKFSLQYSLLAFSLAVFVLRIDYITAILEQLMNISSNAALALRMSTYFGDNIQDRGVYVMYFIYLLFYMWCNIINRRTGYYDSDNKYLRVAHNLIWMYLIFSSLFWKINYLSTRIGWYFLIGFALMVPYFIEQTKIKMYAIVFVFLIDLNLARHFVFPDETTMVFAPYESYIECKWFGVTPTGAKRASQYMASQGGVLTED